MTTKLKLVTGLGLTYEMTCHPVLPYQTSHVRPATVVLPTGEPIGWIEPCRLSQIISSAPFCPSVRGLGSSQMSYAAFHVPLPGYETLMLLVALPIRLTWIGM